MSALRVSARFRAALIACLLCAFVAGCGADDNLVPVEGRVLLQGQPLRGLSGSVTFVPDSSKGNASSTGAVGEIDAEGRYRLSTRGKPGAAPGWYKVVVTAVPAGTGDREVVRRPALHSRYAAEKTTPLSVQVVADPSASAYDLKVTRN
jgi:hypothetical protein